MELSNGSVNNIGGKKLELLVFDSIETLNKNAKRRGFAAKISK